MRIFLIVPILLGFTQYANATIYSASGTVKQIQSVDRVTYGSNDNFLINGLSSAGSCATNDGLVDIVLRDDEGGKRQLAILLSAKQREPL
jgi:hypothetical protein